MRRVAAVILFVVLEVLTSEGTQDNSPRLRRDFENLAGKIQPYVENSGSDKDTPEYGNLVRGLWSIVEEWSTTYLNSRPSTSATDLRGRIKLLSVDTTVVQLKAGRDAAFAVSVHWGWDGTFFIVAEKDGVYRVAWRVLDLAERHLSSRDELGRWAYLSPGFHDGPLTGEVHALPANALGRSRFYVDAVTLPAVGLEKPGQISVWEWTGSDAECLFIRTYSTHQESHAVALNKNALQIHVNEDYKTFFNCGSCDPGPHAIWTLRVMDNGVRDEGIIPVYPEFRVIDQLLLKVQERADASDIATPEVIREFIKQIPPAGKEDSRYIGMGRPSVRRTATGSNVELHLDDWIFTFTLVKRNGQYFVSRASLKSQ